MDPATVHIPVLPAEILEYGKAVQCQTWVDGTAGGGGHCRLVAAQLPTGGRVLGVDRDPAVAQQLRSEFKLEGLDSISAYHASYAEIPEVLQQLEIGPVDAILLDLGLSSDQLADENRGFSFQTEGELDMRFDPTSGEPVWSWLAWADEKTIADTIYEYGEERFSRRIAKRIVESRRTTPIKTADQLREIVYRSVPRPSNNRSKGKHQSFNRKPRIDPATRTFQALRIAINDELGELKRALQSLPDCLAPGGRLLIISFHSLEDRIVKYAFREDERLSIITKKPLIATDLEQQQNPRSRSAKLRVAERK